MRNLKEYIIESIFDIEDNIDNIDESIKEQIKQFLKDNFKGYSSCKISDKPNKDGKYEVSSKGDVVVVKKKSITSLTNGLFIWTTVDKDFKCAFCDLLTSLEGAPKNVGGTFNCIYCNSLTSLKGSPEKVGGKFNCNGCDSLTSLEGAPKEVDGSFYCYNCKLLKSLKGLPKKIGGDFDCSDNDMKFTKNDIKKVSNIKGKIYI